MPYMESVSVAPVEPSVLIRPEAKVQHKERVEESQADDERNAVAECARYTQGKQKLQRRADHTGKGYE